MKSIKIMLAGLAGLVVFLLLMCFPACSQEQGSPPATLPGQKIAHSEAQAQALTTADPADATILPPATPAIPGPETTGEKAIFPSSETALGKLPASNPAQPAPAQKQEATSAVFSPAPATQTPASAAGGKRPATVTQAEKPASRPVTSIQTASGAKPDAGGPYLTEYETQVVALVNARRKQEGLSALTVTASLRDAAHLRVTELTQNYSHTRPDGTSCFTAFPESGASGENIARGQQTPATVMESWMGSEAHRANILDPAFTHIGVGCIRQGDTIYWIQCFTN